MARPKSDDKRIAILDAAIQVFAERGLVAATSAISNAAGVAEGTLFTYFKTKDDLVNALFRALKLELGSAMMTDFPRKKSVKQRMRHVWDSYVQWGILHQQKQKVLKRIEVWDGLTVESMKAASLPFAEMKDLAKEAEQQKIVKDLPRRFVEATMSALAETAMELTRHDPKRAELYRTAGFDMLWAGIARKS